MKLLLNRSIVAYKEESAPGKWKHCTACQNAFSKKYFYRHKCVSKFKPKGVFNRILIPSISDQKFKRDVLSQFRKKGPSNFLLQEKNELWMTLGYEEYKKHSHDPVKIKQAKRRTMIFMNNLAIVFKLFRRYALDDDTQVNFSYMFKPTFSTFLKNALENNEFNQSSKHSTIYSMKTAAEQLKALYIISDDSYSANLVERHQAATKAILPPVLNPIVSNQRKQREIKGRNPDNLPSPEAMRVIRNFIEESIAKILSGGLKHKTDYTLLRRLTITRIMSFNGRRVSEPAYLTISELKDSFRGKWVNTRRMLKQSSNLIEVVEKFYLAYVGAKNSSSVVSVIIPKKLRPALDILIDEENRLWAGIRPDNYYVFAQVKNSHGQCSSYHDTVAVLNEALEGSFKFENITSTKIRHYISTVFAELVLGEEAHTLLCKHLGHDKNINEQVYACPPGLNTLKNVAPFLMRVDEDSRCSAEKSNVLDLGEVRAAEEEIYVPANDALNSSSPLHQSREEIYVPANDALNSSSPLPQSREEIYVPANDALNSSSPLPQSREEIYVPAML